MNVFKASDGSVKTVKILISLENQSIVLVWFIHIESE